MENLTMGENKSKLIEAIQEITNEKIIQDIAEYVRELCHTDEKASPPCVYTLEELQKGIELSISEMEQGQLISHQDVIEQMEKYLHDH